MYTIAKARTLQRFVCRAHTYGEKIFKWKIKIGNNQCKSVKKVLLEGKYSRTAFKGFVNSVPNLRATKFHVKFSIVCTSTKQSKGYF